MPGTPSTTAESRQPPRPTTKPSSHRLPPRPTTASNPNPTNTPPPKNTQTNAEAHHDAGDGHQQAVRDRTTRFAQAIQPKTACGHR